MILVLIKLDDNQIAVLVRNGINFDVNKEFDSDSIDSLLDDIGTKESFAVSSGEKENAENLLKYTIIFSIVSNNRMSFLLC